MSREGHMTDYSNIAVLAVDVFGTVVDFSGVPYAEKKAYADHIKQPEWSPLRLPERWRYSLVAHPDSAKGLNRLRKKYTVVPLTNGPVRLIADLSFFNDLEWCAYFPLESYKVFKPDPRAYRLFVETFSDCEPSRCLMVTANEKFGDLEAARSLGMQAVLIRGDDGGPKDLIELAERMGC